MNLWAHRGAHADAVENTMAAFEAAIALDAHGVELDVRATADAAVVVFHDADLERLASDPRRVAELPRGALPSVGGAPVPLLDEALDRLLAAGLEVNVEVKAAPLEAARVLAARSSSERDAVIVSCFDADALAAVRDAVTVRTAYLFERVTDAVAARLAEFDGVHPHHEACAAEAVAAWRRAGRFVNAWTVNDPDRAVALRDLGIDGLVTDDVAGAREACGSRV